MRIRRFVRERRDPVQREPRTDPIALRRGQPEDRGRVADARRDTRRGVDLAERCAETPHLLFGHRLADFVGAREMRHRAYLERRNRKRAQSPECRAEILRAEPEAVHARVHLDPQNELLRAAVSLE
jgi:hypothetical protein